MGTFKTGKLFQITKFITLSNETWNFLSVLQLFVGNQDENTVVKNHFMGFVLARKIRIHPQTWENSICLRAEVYGIDYHSKLTLIFKVCHLFEYSLSLPVHLVKYLFILFCVSFIKLWAHNIGQVQVIAGFIKGGRKEGQGRKQGSREAGKQGSKSWVWMSWVLSLEYGYFQ